MTKLYSRMFPVILILIFEITIATVALTNVWAAVAFYAQKGGSASQDEMYYVAVNDNSGGNIQYQEYESNAVKNVKAFFDDISSADCWIWVYPMALEVSDGDNVLCRLYLSTNEDDEYFNQGKGVYVGNDIKYYCKNNKIKIYSEEFDVLGYLDSDGFEKNSMIHARYGDFSEVSKEQIADYIVNQTVSSSGNNSFTIFSADSNIKELIRADAEKYNMVLKEEDDQAEDGRIVYSHDVTNRIFKPILFVLLSMACFGLLVQTMIWFIDREKETIIIKKIYGISITRIYFPMYIVALISWISGSVISFIFQYIVDYLVLGYEKISVMKYTMVSTGASFILIIFILLITSLIYYCKSDKIINKINREGSI